MNKKKLLGIISFIIIILLSVNYLKSKSLTLEDDDLNNFISEKESLPQREEEVSLIFIGDISFSRGVEEIVTKKGSIHYPFEKTGEYIKSSDLAFANLETPITAGAKIPDFNMVFRSNPGTERALKDVGFSIVSLANNHTLDFGEKGLRDTMSYLKDVGIEYVGAGENAEEANRPVYIEKNSIRFAFLAYTDNDVIPATREATEERAGNAFMNKEKMISAVKEAKKRADFVIVSMHSGVEYSPSPNRSQIDFAHSAIDAGADLVVGHHPHVVQPVEKYKGGFIFYSLGNFIFDQMWSQDTREGVMIKAYFTKEGISRISFLPYRMEYLAQPSIVQGDNILKRLETSLKDRKIYYWDDGEIKESSRPTIYLNKSKSGNLSKIEVINNSVYSLEKGKLIIKEGAKIIWESPNDWWIDDFIIADSNNDGELNVNLSFWKRGSFGSSKPFWVERDESIGNHLFVYDNELKLIWGSSNLDAPNCELKFADIDGDGENELIVIEGSYETGAICQGEYLAIWKWNGWGFSNIWRSEKGNFSNLEIEGNKILVTTD